MGNSPTREKTRPDDDIDPAAREETDWERYCEESPDPDLFIVLYDFQSEEDNQLTVKKGDKVQSQDWDENKDWCTVTFKLKSGFVPTGYIAPWKSLQKYPWYHGPIQRSAAEYILRSEVEGAFLVRESESNPGQFCLSIKIDCTITHYRISEDSGKFYLTTEKTYDSLPELIKALHVDPDSGIHVKLGYSVPKKNKPTIYEVCPGIPDKWELDRSDLELLEKLGSGQYGDVYKAKHARLKRTAAVKTLKDAISAEEFVKEAALMKAMKHPNLVQLLGVCTKRTPFYIVMEFMSKGNLLKVLRQNNSDLTPTVLLYMANQVASAMAYLESKNFIHRDLAARNCLVGEDHIVKVADFGLARVVNEETYTSQSSPLLPIKWTAPEGLAFSVFSSKSDVWAFGVLLYEMVTYGLVPYPKISIADIYTFLEEGGRMERPPSCPPKVYQLMRRCWEWDPERRPTFKEIRQELDDLSYKGPKQQVTMDFSEFQNSPKTSSVDQPNLKIKIPFEIQTLHPNRLPKTPQTPILGRLKSADVRSEANVPPKLTAKSHSVGETATGETNPPLSYKHELLQKINRSDTCKGLIATKQSPPPTNSKPQLVRHPPFIPLSPKSIKRPQVAPPPPPPKPIKENNSLPRTAPKLPLPPTVPLKPWQANKNTRLEGSSRPNVPLKPLSSPHSC